MNILALDTAGPIPSVAVLAGERLFEELLPRDRRASEELLPAIGRALTAAALRLDDCERFVVCAGPGSFTGLRVGLATAWSFGRALGRPVEAVSTLEAVAEAARPRGAPRVAAFLDAGRGELVGEVFDLSADRARSLAPAARVSVADAASLASGAAIAALPADLVGAASRSPSLSLAEAIARAAARSPRDAASSLAAIYSRSSAAEEKHGAA
jgi:tRNA threonylcarbamoyl adenosine modification protein YeaZ